MVYSIRKLFKPVLITVEVLHFSWTLFMYLYSVTTPASVTRYNNDDRPTGAPPDAGHLELWKAIIPHSRRDNSSWVTVEISVRRPMACLYKDVMLAGRSRNERYRVFAVVEGEGEWRWRAVAAIGERLPRKAGVGVRPRRRRPARRRSAPKSAAEPGLQPPPLPEWALAYFSCKTGKIPVPCSGEK